MNAPQLMNESLFHARVDAILIHIEEAMDDIEADVDSQLTAGILTLTFEDGSKVIVNRQTPLREIWVAAKTGGFHFRGTTDEAVDSKPMRWIDTRSGETLEALLSRVLSLQSRRVIEITFNA